MSGVQAIPIRLQSVSSRALFPGNGGSDCLHSDGLGGRAHWLCKQPKSIFGGHSLFLKHNAGLRLVGRPKAKPVSSVSCASDTTGRGELKGRSILKARGGHLPQQIIIPEIQANFLSADSKGVHLRTEGQSSFTGATFDWSTRAVKKAGHLLAAACLALAWMLAKPQSALAATRPLTTTASYASKLSDRSSGVVRNVQTSASDFLVSEATQLDNNERASTSQSSSTVHYAAYAQSQMQGSAFKKPPRLLDLDSGNQEWVQNLASDASQPSSSFKPLSKFPSFHMKLEDPLESVPRDGGASASVSDASPSQGGEGDPSSKNPRGVQQREKLDVYYLPEQIPKPEAGNWVSDQGEFIAPDWISPRMNQIVTGLQKDTGTEIYVVAINALGKHAGVPEMVATEICSQWKIGGPKGNGLLFLYVNKGGSSWERTEEGDVEMDVTYKRQLAVKVLPGLEQRLNKWGRKNGKKSAEEAIAELRSTVMVKMGIENATVGEVILEGLVSVAEKVWAAEGLEIPAHIRKDPTKVRKLTDLETIAVALGLYAVWAWFDRGTLLSSGLSDAYGWFSGAYDRFSRRAGPPCRACGEYTKLSGQAKPEEITDPGARKEVELNSTNYFRYVCENLDCKGSQEEKLSLVGWGIPFRAKTCPGCGYRTVKQTSETVQRPGIFSEGKIKRAVECLNCGLKGEGYVRDPSFAKALSLPWERQTAELANENGQGINGRDGSAGDAQPAGP